VSFLKTLLAQGLIDQPALQKLHIFVDLILEWNQRINLTGFHQQEEIEEILIGEALLALKFLWISGQSILDFGSGAGIPGIVWALCDPSANVTSIESRQKKVAFQKEVLRQTGATAEVIWGRFPEATPRREFDMIATRAIRISPVLWSDAKATLKSGGKLVRFGLATDPVGEEWSRYFLSNRSDLLVSTNV
jgi:16S rRNA (guanine527-N7)-methyltransferase